MFHVYPHLKTNFVQKCVISFLIAHVSHCSLVLSQGFVMGIFVGHPPPHHAAPRLPLPAVECYPDASRPPVTFEPETIFTRSKPLLSPRRLPCNDYLWPWLSGARSPPAVEEYRCRVRRMENCIGF